MGTFLFNAPRAGQASRFAANSGANPDSPPTPHRENIFAKCKDVSGKKSQKIKADRHCHGFLSAPLSIYEQILEKKLPVPPKIFPNFTVFNQYIFDHLVPAIRDLESLRLIVRGAFDQWVRDDVRHVEPSFDLMVLDLLGISLNDWMKVLLEEIERVSSKLKVFPEIGVNRKLPADLAFTKVKEWIATGAFYSIDLYDDENHGSVDDFAPLYGYAKDKGLKLKAHAGELCGAEKVRESVEKLGLDQVQHGIRAIEDPRVVELLVEKKITLNICPTSNVALKIVSSYEAHPAKKLFDAGVSITINTDDFALFGSSLTQELAHLPQMGFSPIETF